MTPSEIAGIVKQSVVMMNIERKVDDAILKHKRTTNSMIAKRTREYLDKNIKQLINDSIYDAIMKKIYARLEEDVLNNVRDLLSDGLIVVTLKEDS